MNALLAIKPEFAKKILAGEKEVEFRRTTFRDPGSIDRVYLYASSPSKQIVGRFAIQRIVEAAPEELWELYGEQSGIDDRERFMEYFDGTEIGYGIRIESAERLEKPLDPNEVFDEFVPPVSFNYLASEKEATIEDQFPEPTHLAETTKLLQFCSD